MMLRQNAISGRMLTSRRAGGLPSSAAPQLLQKFAPSTITGCPHREQNRGRSKKSASGTEGKRSVADPHRVSIFQGSFANPLAAHKSSILAAQIPYLETAVPRFDRGMMTRDRGIGEHNIVVGCAPNPGFLVLYREAIARRIDQDRGAIRGYRRRRHISLHRTRFHSYRR